MSAQTRALVATEQEIVTFHHEERGINTALLGMILFICSEVMFFGGLFAAYFSVRAKHQVWPPEGAEHFGANVVVVVATILLVLSSFTLRCNSVGVAPVNRLKAFRKWEWSW